MIIDKDAKLFGKINIIDICIVLAVLVVAVFAATKLKGNVVVTNESKKFEMKFFVEEVENFRVENMAVGDNLYDDSKNLFLGNHNRTNRHPF